MKVELNDGKYMTFFEIDCDDRYFEHGLMCVLRDKNGGVIDNKLLSSDQFGKFIFGDMAK